MRRSASSGSTVAASAVAVSAMSGGAAVCSGPVTMAWRASTQLAASPCDGERGGDDAAAEDLAGRGDRVEPARRDLAQDAKRAGQPVELVELRVDEPLDLGPFVARADHAGDVEMTLAKRAEALERRRRSRHGRRRPRP